MSTYIRLTDYKDSESKEQGFFEAKNRYVAKQDDFAKIPGSPIAYWVSDKIIKVYEKGKTSDIAVGKEGLKTGDNEKFLRLWFEIDNFSKWRSIVKGGLFRKWYGNFEYVVNWEDAGMLLKEQNNSSIPNDTFLNREFITWSNLTSGKFSMRFVSKQHLFETKSPGMFSAFGYNILLGFYNSSIADYFLKVTSPTLDYKIGPVVGLPFQKNIIDSTKQTIDKLTQECIDISKEEWDSRETSWDFRANPLLWFARDMHSHAEHGNERKMPTLETVYKRYCDIWREKFYKLHANEEELNRLFIDIYELQDELTPDVELKDITILKQEADIVDGEFTFNAEEIRPLLKPMAYFHYLSSQYQHLHQD